MDLVHAKSGRNMGATGDWIPSVRDRIRSTGFCTDRHPVASSDPPPMARAKATEASVTQGLGKRQPRGSNRGDRGSQHG